MRTAPDLNAYPRPQWAAVVSGQVWKAHTLTADGALSSCTVRGPVVVWGQVSGEGQDVPPIHPPTPSPLEVQATRQNMAPHFLAFVRAARGKVRHSVRWKTGRRRVLSTLTRFLMGVGDFKVSEWGLLARAYAKRWAKYAIQSKKRNRRIELLEAATDLLDIDIELESETPGFSLRQTIRSRLLELSRANIPYWLRMEGRREVLPGEPPYTFSQDWGALVAFEPSTLPYLLSIVRKADLSMVFALRALQADAFRAHITRRVRPVSRRTRIPRPLYARPRPPTAPLAPPVI